MGGLSAGGFFVARWDARFRNRLLGYGVAEALIGVFCFVSPALFAAIGDAYVALVHAVPASKAVLTMLRCLLATTVVFVPPAGMGATFPLLAPVLARRNPAACLSPLYALI